MPFRALIRAAERDATVKVGLDGRGLYVLNDQDALGEAAGDQAWDHFENAYDRGADPTRGPSDWDEQDDITYQDMDVDTLLLGVLDEVVGLLPNRRRALDLGRGDGYDQNMGAQGPSREHDNVADPDQEEQVEGRQAQNGGARFAWRQLGMIGATAVGLVASVFL
ncbi:hypothetical protein BSKO_12717 [Bryopsis sp. KO-2023]|nr:hypothetical protein BSKO_12717 [Bryopsis sp. KO-2023]